MAQADIKIVQGPYMVQTFQSTASATAINAGEPVELVGGGHASGAADINTITAGADDNPIIGTDDFVGISNAASTHTSGAAGTCSVCVPAPTITRMRGKAETTASVDTAAELTAILFDAVVFGLASSVYTIIQTATADTSPLQIVDGNIVKGTLDVTIDSRAFRNDIS